MGLSYLMEVHFLSFSDGNLEERISEGGGPRG